MASTGIGVEIDDAADRISKLKIGTAQSDDGESTRHEDKIRYNQLVLDGKEKGRQGHVEQALVLFKQAFVIHQSDKLRKRIEKLESIIQEYKAAVEEEGGDDEEEDDDGLVEVGNGFRLAKEIYEALYAYQKDTLLWLWGLFNQRKGGILGDDMGLGKTIQIIAFLAGMFDCSHIKSALIVMPVSLINNWEKEFQKWAPGIRVKQFHGSSKKERLRNLERVQRKHGVCLTTYGMVMSNVDLLSSNEFGRSFTWDYIILDEGHKIKNTTKTSKSVRAIPARHHFILTGTPVQNNLKEMWALFDFVTEGQLLGTSRTFKKEFADPIVRARERDASAYEKRIGAEMSEMLRELIAPHFLRRTKAMVLENRKTCDNTDSAPSVTASTKVERVPEKLTRKNDFIVWLFLSESQLKIYRDFIGLERVKEMLMSKRSPLAELNVMKKICDHPRLLSAMACQQLGLDEECRSLQIDDDKENSSQFSSQATGSYGSGPGDETLIAESGKLVFLVALMENLRSEGHRCLIFSQSRKMLDIIQRVLSNLDHKMLRIDGTITSTVERERLIMTFQKDPSYSCFLLTTQVGGVGITLTAADRVVVFDPSWNPATDAQAVDRVYRIGQKRSVVIYRLITCGTLEEKIYRKQIFKDALMKQTTGMSKNPFRYFSRQELQDMFRLEDPKRSDTQAQLEKLHAQHRNTDPELRRHVEFLQSLEIFGLSDHDLMYSQEAVEAPEEALDQSYNNVIHARVKRAQDLVAQESTMGIATPSTAASCPRPPKKVLGSGSVDNVQHHLPPLVQPLSARGKIQTQLNQFEVFKPSREDTKRFIPRNVPKVFPPADVIDLSSPPMHGTSENDKDETRASAKDRHDDGQLDPSQDPNRLSDSNKVLNIQVVPSATLDTQSNSSPVPSPVPSKQPSLDLNPQLDSSMAQQSDSDHEMAPDIQNPKMRLDFNPALDVSSDTGPVQQDSIIAIDVTPDPSLVQQVQQEPSPLLESSPDPSPVQHVQQKPGPLLLESSPESSPVQHVQQKSSPLLESSPEPSPVQHVQQKSGPLLESSPEPSPVQHVQQKSGPFLESSPESSPVQHVQQKSGPLLESSPEPSPVQHVQQKSGPLLESSPEPSPVQHVQQKSGPLLESSPEPSPVQHVQQKSGPFLESSPESSPVQHVQQKSGPLLESSPEPSPVQHVQQKSGPLLESSPESSPVQPVQQKSGPPIESSPESSPVQPLQQKSGPLDESSPECSPVQNVQQKSGPLLESSPESSPVQHVQQKSGPLLESSPESSPVQLLQQKSGPLLESSPESSPVQQKEEDLCAKQTPRRSLDPKRRRSMSQQLVLPDSDEDDEDFESPPSTDGCDTSPPTHRGARMRVVRINSSEDEESGSGFESVPAGCVMKEHCIDGGCPSGVHISQAVNIQRCACLVNEEEMSKYEVLLTQARDLQNGSKSHAALSAYLQALAIMDSDLKIHREVLMLHESL